MAGSYNHAVTDDGKLRAPGESMMVATETGGDSYETIEEMYGMIWWLADLVTEGDPGQRAHWVEMARQNYTVGLGMSPGLQTEEEFDAYMRTTYPDQYRR